LNITLLLHTGLFIIFQGEFLPLSMKGGFSLKGFHVIIPHYLTAEAENLLSEKPSRKLRNRFIETIL
jgi:hypothetical protein